MDNAEASTKHLSRTSSRNEDEPSPGAPGASNIGAAALSNSGAYNLHNSMPGGASSRSASITHRMQYSISEQPRAGEQASALLPCSDPGEQARVQALVSCFREQVQVAYLQLLGCGPDPSALRDATRRFYAALAHYEAALAAPAQGICRAAAAMGPMALGPAPGHVEACVGPMAVRMLAVLPVMRELDLVVACYSMGLTRVGAWLQVRTFPLHSFFLRASSN